VEVQAEPEPKGEKMALVDTMEFVNGLYQKRNDSHLPIASHICLFFASGGFFLRINRKLIDDPTIRANALASVFARTSTLAIRTVGSKVLSGSHLILGKLFQKYPESGCAYCGNLPCKCEKHRRPEPANIQASGVQQFWTLTEWCQHIRRVYGPNNRKNGIEYVTNQLLEEILEVTMLLEPLIVGERLEDSELVMVAAEFADVFARIFALADMYGVVDFLEDKIDTHYAQCKRCGKRPCECGSIYGHEDRANVLFGPRADSVTI